MAQGRSIGAGGNMGAPSTQLCTVHSRPSSCGRSVSSTIGVRPPSPSQINAWQSPGSWSCVGATLPRAANVRPHTPAVHVFAAQNVSSPHSSGVAQPTHWPLASQLRLPSPHSLPGSRSVCVGVFPSHVSVVQSFRSSGRSLSRVTEVTPPAPLH